MYIYLNLLTLAEKLIYKVSFYYKLYFTEQIQTTT